MPSSTRSCACGQQVERLLGDRERVHAVLVGPQQQRRRLDQPVGVEQVHLRADGPAARGPRPGTRAVGVAADAHERVPHEVARRRVAARGQALAHGRPVREPAGVGDEAIQPRHRGGAERHPGRALQAFPPRALVHRVGHQHQPPGRQLARDDGAQEDQRARLVAAHERPRPAHVAAEARHHLRHPVRRVGMVGAVLGVAVQRQVREHEPEAVARAPPPAAPTRGARAASSAAARAGVPCRPRGRRPACRRGGGRGAASTRGRSYRHRPCSAPPTTAGSSRSPSPRWGRSRPSRCTCSSTRRSSGTSGRRSSPRWRSRPRCSPPRSRCSTSSPTAPPRTSPGCTAPAARRRPRSSAHRRCG